MIHFGVAAVLKDKEEVAVAIDSTSHNGIRDRTREMERGEKRGRDRKVKEREGCVAETLKTRC